MGHHVKEVEKEDARNGEKCHKNLLLLYLDPIHFAEVHKDCQCGYKGKNDQKEDQIANKVDTLEFMQCYFALKFVRLFNISSLKIDVCGVGCANAKKEK